jgi:Putative adhesin
MRRSITGPLILLLVGGLFLWRNFHPEVPVFDLLSQYWPFLLILWGLLRLAETLFSRGQWRSGFSGGEIVLIVFICFIGVSTWQAREFGIHFDGRGLDIFGDSFDYPIDAKASAAGMTRVVFENPRGSIRVTGGDVAEVTVTGHKSIRAYKRADADHANDNTPLEILPQGDHLVVRTNQDRAPGNQRITDDLEVTVPRSMAIESHNNVGDDEVSDVKGDVDLASNHGDLRLARIGGNARLSIGHSDVVNLTDVAGKVDLEGHGSDLTMENVAGQVTVNGSYSGAIEFKNLAKPLDFEGVRGTELHVAAIPGTVHLDLSSLTASNVTGPLRFVARSRDIHIEQFTQSIQVETDRGDIELHPGKTPLSPIEATTKNGAINLSIPEGATFQLEGTVERGEAANEYGPPLHQENSGRRATIHGGVGDGPTITLLSDHGRIVVEKEGAGAEQAGKSLKDSEVKM